MWEPEPIEAEMKRRLIAEKGAVKAEAILSNYIVCRNKVINDVANEFKAAEPELSDHSPAHIADVLGRAFYLLADGSVGSYKIKCLNSAELYLLCMMIVFHDVGNLFGRVDHQKHVAAIFDWACGNTTNTRRERAYILSAVQAHTGKTATGSLDTLAELQNDHDLFDLPIRLRDLAAVLRFADELAEGPHRTSAFKLDKNMYSAKNSIYHQYAAITHTHVDRQAGRVRLTYEVSIAGLYHPVEYAKAEAALLDLLSFTYKRIVKLDQERRYARYYSPMRLPFPSTSIYVNFQDENGSIPLGLSPIVLDEKVVPGDETSELVTKFTEYAPAALIAKLKLLRKSP